MSNTWKYSTLSQRERLKMISGGDGDVYNTEKEKNSALRNERQALGLDTSNIDLWDKTIDSAYSKATDPRRVVDRGQPKFQSYRMERLNRLLNAYIDDLERKAKKSTQNALDNATESSNYLTEWIANNGYSLNGSMYKREKEKITRTLAETIKSINDDFAKNVTRARESFLKQASK